MPVKFEFSIAEMKHLKEAELPGLRNLIMQCIPRQRPVYSLSKAATTNSIIAEIKCASPTKGEIKKLNVTEQAKRYERGGAVGISVLTESNFFGGKWSDLYSAAQSVQLPILCKDFIFFEEQINVAWILGADMVLIIARALEKKQLKNLYECAMVRGIMPLVEVHNTEELALLKDLNVSHVVVNARNLETLKIEEDVAKKTWRKLPSKIIKIWASGVSNPNDIVKIKHEIGAQFFLIGTALMESDNAENLLREMCNVR